jgi:hypothetical protein
MKEKSRILALIPGLVVALPAQAGSGLIKITHAAHVQPAASISAIAQAKVRQATPEFQVAVKRRKALNIRDFVNTYFDEMLRKL